MYELPTEMHCCSIDGKGREEKPPVDLLFTRKGAPQKHERHLFIGTTSREGPAIA
jgi:hypothetical protein